MCLYGFDYHLLGTEGGRYMCAVERRGSLAKRRRTTGVVLGQSRVGRVLSDDDDCFEIGRQRPSAEDLEALRNDSGCLGAKLPLVVPFGRHEVPTPLVLATFGLSPP